jgi:signal transduction histidine kinase
MFTRLRRFIRQHPDLIDAAAAVVLACLLGLASADHRLGGGSPVLRVLVTAAVALPLAVRRRNPYVALAGILVLIGVVYALTPSGTANVYPPVVPVFPAVIALYTVGTVGSRRTILLVGAVALVVAATLALAILRPEHVVGEIVHAIAWVTGSLAVGSAVASRRAYVDQFRQRALQAERTKEEEAQRRVYEERTRIARDVHDGVAHALASISIQAGAGSAVLDSDPEGARQALQAIRLASASALSDLRATLGLLRHEDGAVVESGFDADLVDRLADVLRAEGIRVSVHWGGHPRALGGETAVAAKRILQEALTNVLRHAEAREVEIGLDYVGDEFILIVTDDGKGPATKTKEPPGYGLVGMRERAVAVGGSLEYGSREGGGFYVQAVLLLGGGS